MQAFVRPLLTPWILLLTGAPFLLYIDASVPPIVVLGMVVFLTIFLLVHCAVSAIPVRRYLAGMAEAGARPAIQRDSYGALGARLVHVDAIGGRWRLAGQFNRYGGLELDVLPPDKDRPVEISKRFRQEGNAMARRLLNGEASSGQKDELETLAAEYKASAKAAVAEETADDEANDITTAKLAKRQRILFKAVIALAVSLVMNGLAALFRVGLNADGMAVTLLGGLHWVTVVAGGTSGAVIAGLWLHLRLTTRPAKIGSTDVWPLSPGIGAGIGGFAIGMALTLGTGHWIASGQWPGLYVVPLLAGVGSVLLMQAGASLPRTQGKLVASVGLWLICLAGVHWMMVTPAQIAGGFIFVGGLIALFMIWDQRNEQF